MCSRSRNTPTPTTAYASIGSTLRAKTRSRFSLNSAVARWHSSRTATNRAELSIAAETSSYLGKVVANLRGGYPRASRLGTSWVIPSDGRRGLSRELGQHQRRVVTHL